jgi:hypothetical protein
MLRHHGTTLVAALGIGALVEGVLMDLTAQLGGQSHGGSGHAAGHEGHLVILAGMVVVLVAVVMRGATTSRLRSGRHQPAQEDPVDAVR